MPVGGAIAEYEIVAEGDLLGESPFWSSTEQALYWVDMLGRRIRRLFPGSGVTEAWPAPGWPTSLALCRTSGAIVGLNNAVTAFDFHGRFKKLCVPEPGQIDQRLNEGCCDPRGRLWVGSMKNNIARDGRVIQTTESAGFLYCVDTDCSVQRTCEDAFGIPNTMIWTQEGTFLIGDSLSEQIYIYDYLDTSNRIVHRRPFSKTKAPGVPDGSAMDCEGGIWNARYGGSCLVRFSPQGEIDRIITLPSINPTSCAFGGPVLETLFVTTASVGLPSGSLAHPSAQGAVLAIHPGVRGLPSRTFAG